MGTPMTYISGNTGTYQSGTFNKGTIALNLNPTSLGSGNNWYNGVDVTATQYLIYSDTYTTGIASQANSKPTAWTTPDLSDTSLLNLINTLPDRVGLLPFTSLPLALQWLNATNEYFLIKTNFENIVTSGLVLNLDAAWYNSYSGTTTWFDRSGSGNHVTLRNGPTFDSSSQGSIVFDGTDDYAGNDSPILPTGNVTITICAWINVQTIRNDWQGIVGWGNTSSSRSALLDMNNGRLAFSTWGGVGSEDLISTYNVPLKTWKFIVGSINNKNIKLYADGIKVLDASITSTPNVASTALRIATTDYPGRLLNTKVASVQIYNKELTDQEILQNYNAQKSRFGFYDFVQSGLTYSYDAGNYLSYPRSGTTWSNMSNSSNSGTFINGPTFITGDTTSIQFDGSNDYVSAGNGKTLNNMTFQMSVKVNSNAGGYKAFGGAVGGSSDYNTGFNIDMQGNSTVSFSKCSIEGGFLTVGGGTNFMTSSVPFGTWKNICFTVSPTYIQFYLDGVKQFGTNRLNNGSSTIGMNSLVIGARPYSLPNTSINANIRDVIIYDRALSDSEVVQNFETSRKNNVGLTGYTTNGLVLNLDAGNYASYPTTGTKWVDISGSYNNGDLINGPTWSSASGGTITFDGTDDRGVINNYYPVFTGDFAINLWVNFSTYLNYQNVISSANDGNAVLGFWLEFGSARGFTLYSTGTNLIVEDNLVSLTSLSTNAWHNVCVTRVGTGTNNVKLYVDNVLCGQNTSNLTVGSASQNLEIARYAKNAGNDYLFGGKIAVIQTYNNVGFSASEVLQNYNALKGRFGL
jgi:hypothetical protein